MDTSSSLPFPSRWETRHGGREPTRGRGSSLLQVGRGRARLPSGIRMDRRLVALLVLVLVALLLRDGSLPHQHLGARAGLYNHDHDLSTLATVAGGLVPDRPEAGPVLVALAPIAPPAIAVRSAAPRRHADPRAPPRPVPPRSA